MADLSVHELRYAIQMFSRIECQNCDFKTLRTGQVEAVTEMTDTAKRHARRRGHTIKIIDETIHTYRADHG